VTPLTNSTTLTVVGYLAGIVGQLIFYPIFGLVVSLQGIFTLGFIFTVIAFASNYFTLKVIEYFEKEKETDA